MDNYEIENMIEENINLMLEIIEDNDEALFEVIKYNLLELIKTSYKEVKKTYICEKINNVLFRTIINNPLLLELNNYSLIITNALVKVFKFLLTNIYYLDDFDNTENLITYINILKNSLLLEMTRRDYVSLNSNDGRTVLANYKLDDMNLLMDKIKKDIDKFDNNFNRKLLKNDK